MSMQPKEVSQQCQTGPRTKICIIIHVVEDKQTMSYFLRKLEKLCSRTDHFPRSIPSKIDAYPRELASISAPL